MFESEFERKVGNFILLWDTLSELITTNKHLLPIKSECEPSIPSLDSIYFPNFVLM